MDYMLRSLIQQVMSPGALKRATACNPYFRNITRIPKFLVQVNKRKNENISSSPSFLGTHKTTKFNSRSQQTQEREHIVFALISLNSQDYQVQLHAGPLVPSCSLSAEQRKSFQA
jgi:hypothetical protein